MQRKVFLGISPQKYQKKAGRNSTRYISTLRRENLSLTGCSSAEPVSVSVQHCKSQIILLYLQLVKKDSHLPIESGNSFANLHIVFAIVFCCMTNKGRQKLQQLFANTEILEYIP